MTVLSQWKGILQTSLYPDSTLEFVGQRPELIAATRTTGQKKPRMESSFPALVPWCLLV